MKRVILVSVLSLGIFVSCGKENAKSKIKKENLVEAQKRDANSVGAPIVSFDKSEYDFGTVNEGEIVETTFVLTNKGKSDLLILDAKATCGCTVPKWSKDPIKPGEKSEIQVRFNTSGKPNKQTKTVTLTTNTEKGIEMVKISGMVKPKKKK
ncbi:MAG: DUF1573 domain-containing protein [Tenacibaculum sp.]|nr:DUF1573 domain-containing protein [Tenacibaculum sp.]